VIAGVAGGLATWLAIDPSLVRVAWVLLAIFSGGLFVIVYIVMMFVVPLPPPGWIPRPRGYGGAGSGAAPGWQPGSGWTGEAPGAAGQGWQPGAGGQPDAQGQGWPAGGAGQPAAPEPASGWSTQPPQAAWTAPRRGNAGLVAGVVLIVLGVWFLIDQYVRIDWDLIWPVVIMVAGGGLIAAALLRSRSG
jgi:phage shock protein PspC (stress-responsive transcriptional regulator)